jgi:hypothetical protein
LCPGGVRVRIRNGRHAAASSQPRRGGRIEAIKPALELIRVPAAAVTISGQVAKALRVSSINPVGKRPVRRSGCYLGCRQFASLDWRLRPALILAENMMLRMVLVGLLIPLGVGVLAAMELATPPRTTATVVQPLAETTVGISDSPGALAKTDRLEVTYAKSEMPTELGPVDQPISPSEAATIAPPEAPRIINRHWHDPKTSRRHDLKTKRVTSAALPKSKPKTPDIKRAAIPDRSRAGSGTEPCRLSAFGGLLKALNSSGCEI